MEEFLGDILWEGLGILGREKSLKLRAKSAGGDIVGLFLLYEKKQYKNMIFLLSDQERHLDSHDEGYR